MAILVSFVNQVFTPELRLGLYHEKEDSFGWIAPDLPWDCKGASGMAASHDLIYVCYQQAGLVVYDYDFDVRQVFDFRSVRDSHSIVLHGGALYVVSSGTNEIYRIKLDGQGLAVEEELFWRVPDLPDYEKDMVHLNSLAVSPGGEFYATYFGMKNPEGWENTLEGEIINVSTGEVVARNLQNPHTLYFLGDRLIFCESKTGDLRDAGGVLCNVGGYVRGITESEGHLIVASSARRRISKSQGVLKGRVGEFFEGSRKSFLSFLDKKSFEVVERRETSSFGKELYDLLLLQDEKIRFEADVSRSKDFRIERFEENVLGLVDRIEHLSTEVHSLGREIIKLRNKEKELEEIKDSVSWKVTFPLRWVGKHLKAGKGANGR